MADDGRPKAETPKHPSGLEGDADTMPAAGFETGERDRRPTIPEIAPPIEERYRLGIELGRGGMGRVVEAFDTQLGRTVALKEVLPKGGPAMERRFRREVEITARLEHASIVPLYDSGVMPDGRPFYVMRRVTGRPFDELITRARGLPERIAMLPNLLAAIDAIAHAHRRGVIHRDLKPANILVGELGETVVIDWGLAKVIGEEEPSPPSNEPRVPVASDSLQTQVGSVFGTPGFMAPEQARGEELGPRGDVFALGATLYQLLVGRPPVAGRSATDVIESTLRHKIEPIATAAPSAPPELVAIVDKALAFEPGDRYADAGVLAEDVRRFLTGQLVAAHNYTRRQRVARFARRHRAPLSVAALAAVAVAVLAWVSVHRILVERDVAKDAKLDADREKTNAIHKTEELEDRNDSLLVTRARAVVDVNPTEALAVLKDLRPGSPHLADARATARAAVMRGVAWGLRAEGIPIVLAVDRDVTELAEMTFDGVLHVWDLETHRVIYERRYGLDARPAWIDGGRLLMVRTRQPPEVFDPRTGDVTKLGLPPIADVIVTDRGDRAAYGGSDGLGILDLHTLVATPVWPGHRVQSIAYAPDGSWVAAADAAGCVVFDAAGKELAHHDGSLTLYGSRDHVLGVVDATRRPAKVYELAIGPDPAWVEIVLAPKTLFITAHYRGRELELVTTAGIEGSIHGKPVHHAEFSEWDAQTLANVGPGVTLRPARDGTIRFWSNAGEGTIVLPVAMPDLHLAGRPGKTRFVAASAGVVLVYDLADVLPIAVPKRGMFEAVFADDDTLLVWPDNAADWRWHDLVTGADLVLDHPLRMPTDVLGIEGATGEILLREQISATRSELVILTKGKTTVRHVTEGNHLRARLVTGGLIFGSSDDPRVMVSLHEEPPRELAKVEGGVTELQPLDAGRFAALGGRGELVRGSLTGSQLERVHVDLEPDGFIGTDRAGHVLIASGTHLLAWDTGVHEVTQLARPIDRLQATENGVIAILDDNSTVYVELGPKPVVHRLLASSSTSPTVGGEGAWIASAGNGGQVTVIEMPAMARWTLPIHYVAIGHTFGASPTKRRLMQGALGQLEIANLPEPATDLGAWIEERTNAFEGTDGVITWPWQRGP